MESPHKTDNNLCACVCVCVRDTAGNQPLTLLSFS